MAKHINPGMFSVRNIIRKEVQRTRKKRSPIPTILGFCKNCFDLAGNFCCRVLAHVYLWPVHGCYLKGELQTGCVSISTEEQEGLHHCVPGFPACWVRNPSPEPSALLLCTIQHGSHHFSILWLLSVLSLAFCFSDPNATLPTAML